MTARQIVFALIAMGVVIRVAIAFATHGDPLDIESWAITYGALTDGAPFELYSDVNAVGPFGAERYSWPYPPAGLPFVLASGALSEATGLAFHGVVHLPVILADAAIALAVWVYLGWRAIGEQARILAVALVALGPSFIAISGHQGQIDSAAILPPVLALLAWERLPPDRRALAAGLLIGLGGAWKWTPIFALVAFLPAVRSPREGIVLVASAVAVPIALFAPFALSDIDGVTGVLDYRGIPGLGGISLALQPELAEAWLRGVSFPPLSDLSLLVYDHSGPITLAGLAGLALLIWRWKPEPAQGLVMVWLVTFAIAPNFFFQYLVWGLPFFLMAGYVRFTALVEAAFLIPTLLVFFRPWDLHVEYLFVPMMIAIWVGWVVASIVMARWYERRRRAPELAGPSPIALGVPQ